MALSADGSTALIGHRYDNGRHKGRRGCSRWGCQSVDRGWLRAAGPITGGNTVTITGTGFLSSARVDFGSTPSANVNVQSPTELTAVAPPHAAEPVDVTVATANGTSTISTADHYTYLPAPSVTTVTP